MKYQLFVYCSKLGISRDDGLHAECEADSDAAAITELTKRAKDLLFSFDLISCTIIEPKPNGSYGEGREVDKFTLRPQPVGVGTNLYDGFRFDSGPNCKVYKLDKNGKPIIREGVIIRHSKRMHKALNGK